jgi:phosphatidylglycerophosphate synthase
MTDHASHSALNGRIARTRRAALQGAAALLLFAPAAVVAAYLLAVQTGAAYPSAATAATAALVALGSALVLKGLGTPLLYPHGRLGLGNLLTLSRGCGIAVMAGLVLTPVSSLGWALVAMAALVLALDGADGWAARRAGLQSPFGARLDMESDVAFSLTLAALAVALGHVGPWFMALGLPRPAFVLAGRIWPALSAPLPEARWRKTMAGLQMGGQVLLIAPIVAPPASSLLGAVILSATVLSFMVDIRWLFRQTPRP